MKDNHIIDENATLIEALRQLNEFRSDPLVLFAIDKEQCMVGTLTDGDSRRALIAKADLNVKVCDASEFQLFEIWLWKYC